MLTLTLFATLAVAAEGVPGPGSPEPGMLAPLFPAGQAAQPAAQAPAPVEVTAPLLPPAKPEAPAEEEAAEAAAAPTRWLFMRSIQGTWLSYLLDGERTQLYGWTVGSYTASTTDVTNSPVVWNDRANEFLLQQAWMRLERSVVTSGTTAPTFGYRIDALYGSDYRFSIMRGLLNNQLLNSDGNQNLYGVDPIGFFASVYVPTLFQGTEFRVGRLYTPFGVESLEAVSTPLMSRSYAFNWSPPFTHMGIQALFTLSPAWSGTAMFANGNDVFIDPAQEPRFVGTIKYTHPNKKDTFTLGASMGRGKFNEGEPFLPATVALPFEPAGRNNINVLDFVWTHAINPVFNYTFEAIGGYQTNVPSNVVGGIIRNESPTGTAHWASGVHYLNYAFFPWLGGTLRLETFQDFEGQRTGFEGLYTALTCGLQFKPRPGLIVRPEIRYDYNGYNRPFEGEHDILTGGFDMILRW